MEHVRTIALLGGGQLGRMFLENALRYNVEVHVLDPDPKAPCAKIADRFVVGDLNDADTVVHFASEADVVGIEIEHVSVEALARLKAMGKTVVPDPDVLHIIKDKGLQKEFYRKHGIPSSAFTLLEDGRDALMHKTILPAFLKTRSGGYDGKGVMAVADSTDPGTLFAGPCLMEQRVDIALELAVLVVCDAAGDLVTYDPVEMVFDPRFNLVDHLRAPARIPEAVDMRCRQLAMDVARSFGAPGIYAVELFLTMEGDVLVNETAPRAHNSGHHTIEACASSQFDQLLRVYMGWPLGDTTLRSHAAMVNLVGEGGTGTPDPQGMADVLSIANTFPHLYGKAETRTGRKMGHVTMTAPDHTALDQAIDRTRAHCKVIPSNSKNNH